MPLKSGEKISYRFVGERTEYPATVRSSDEDNISLEIKPGAHPQSTSGQYLILFSKDDTYNATVITADAATVTLRRLRTDKQEFFRVDDSFPVVARKVEKDAQARKSVMSIAFGKEFIDRSCPDPSIHPKLWEMLIAINDKLNLVLDQLNLEAEVVEAEPQKVNISASGIRFIMREKVELGDMLEVKMMLPSTPPVTVIAYGNTVSIEDMGNKNYAIALQFVDMDAEVRDRLIQYTLNRQREIIRKQRQLNE